MAQATRGGVRIWSGESSIERLMSERRCGFVPIGLGLHGSVDRSTVKMQKAGRASWVKVPSFKSDRRKSDRCRRIIASCGTRWFGGETSAASLQEDAWDIERES